MVALARIAFVTLISIVGAIFATRDNVDQRAGTPMIVLRERNVKAACASIRAPVIVSAWLIKRVLMVSVRPVVEVTRIATLKMPVSTTNARILAKLKALADQIHSVNAPIIFLLVLVQMDSKEILCHNKDVYVSQLRARQLINVPLPICVLQISAASLVGAQIRVQLESGATIMFA